MSTPNTILTDGSRFSRLDRMLFKFESGLNLLGGVIIFLVALLATVNVLGRWLFDSPVNGYIDWIEQAMAFMAFLGLAYNMRLGSHIRMDIVISTLKERKLWVAEFFSTLLMLLISLVLTYGSYLHFLRAYTIGDSSLDIELPTWPSKLVVPVILGVLCLRLLLQLYGYAMAIKNNNNQPIGVPVIKDASAQAEDEINVALK